MHPIFGLFGQFSYTSRGHMKLPPMCFVVPMGSTKPIGGRSVAQREVCQKSNFREKKSPLAGPPPRGAENFRPEGPKFCPPQGGRCLPPSWAGYGPGIFYNCLFGYFSLLLTTFKGYMLLFRLSCSIFDKGKDHSHFVLVKNSRNHTKILLFRILVNMNF